VWDAERSPDVREIIDERCCLVRSRTELVVGSAMRRFGRRRLAGAFVVAAAVVRGFSGSVALLGASGKP